MKIIEASKRFEQKRAEDLLYRELKNKEILRRHQRMLEIADQLLKSIKEHETNPKR